jgi:hypothetical protein
MYHHGGNHNRGGPEHAARVQVATEFEMGAALGTIAERVQGVQDDLSQQIDAVLATLLPDQMATLHGIPGGAMREPYIGHGEMSVFYKITLVKIVPGAFPSSISVRHADLSGVFILDSTQTSVEVGITQYGQRSLTLINNDPAVDAGVLVTMRRLR